MESVDVLSEESPLAAFVLPDFVFPDVGAWVLLLPSLLLLAGLALFCCPVELGGGGSFEFGGPAWLLGGGGWLLGPESADEAWLCAGGGSFAGGCGAGSGGCDPMMSPGELLLSSAAKAPLACDGSGKTGFIGAFA